MASILIYIIAILFFTFGLLRKFKGEDNAIRAATLQTSADFVVDVNTIGFMTSIEIIQIDKEQKLDIF